MAMVSAPVREPPVRPEGPLIAAARDAFRNRKPCVFSGTEF